MPMACCHVILKLDFFWNSIGDYKLFLGAESKQEAAICIFFSHPILTSDFVPSYIVSPHTGIEVTK